MKIEASVSIGRRSDGKISIEVRDECSLSKFLTIEISPHDFSMAITGLSYIRCDAEVSNIDVIGKSRKSKTVEFEMPEHDYSNMKLVAAQEMQRILDNEGLGWIARDSFSSQGSFFKSGGIRFARGLAVKYE